MYKVNSKHLGRVVIACTTGPIYTPPLLGFKIEAKKNSVILTKSADLVMAKKRKIHRKKVFSMILRNCCPQLPQNSLLLGFQPVAIIIEVETFSFFYTLFHVIRSFEPGTSLWRSRLVLISLSPDQFITTVFLKRARNCCEKLIVRNWDHYHVIYVKFCEIT